MAGDVMDSMKRHLIGSESRDKFKYAHKQIDKRFYATDLDFVLVEKRPPGIVAFLDYKRPRDDVTFAEVLAYNVLKETASLYIIESADPENGPFVIRRYLGGNWRPDPPVIDWSLVGEFENWDALEEWERELREQYGKPQCTL